MNKTVIIVTLILAMAVVFGGCTNTYSPAAPPATPPPVTVERRVNVPMTGVHIEYFDFRQGDMVVGELVVEGKYDVDLSVSYVVEVEGGKIGNVTGSDVLSLEDIEGYEMFTFVAPVSGQYSFFLRGYYADKPGEDWKPFAQLSQEVKLHITVNPK